MSGLLIAVVAAFAEEVQRADGHVSRIMPVGRFVFNGPAPETDAHFDELQRLGIRTIISVDGAVPDLVRASARDMRYVHLPIGYDGLTEVEAAGIARAIRDLPKPVYMHCFHGKHRSPAASAVAMICLGEITNDDGLAFLKRAGTSPKYVGLWEAVRAAQPLDAAVINAAPADFPERFEVSGLVAVMVRIDRTFDHLEEAQSAGWQPPPSHPDLVPQREAEMLAEALATLADATPASPTTAPSSASSRPGDGSHAAGDALPRRARRSPEAAANYRTGLRDSALVASALAAAIAANDHPAADRQLEALDATCTACHRQFRD